MKSIDSDIMTRYLSGKASPEEGDLVLKWMMLNLQSPEADNEFAELLERVPRIKDDDRKNAMKQRLLGFIAGDRKNARRRIVRMLVYGFAGIAACTSAVLAWICIDLNEEMRQVASWSEITAAYGEKKSVKLPDGSVIWLHNETRITYPDRFTKGKRQVFVSGEIYAEIAQDAENPFVVTSDNVNLIVHGTTFNYASYPHRNKAEVTLLEGNVSLNYMLGSQKRVIDVAPGEVVSIDLDTDRVTRQLYDTKAYVSWRDKNVFYFKDITLEQIVQDLQREFEIRIVIKDKALAGTRHYASFVNGESPLEMLETICAGSGMKVYKKNSTIFISTN